MLVPFEVFQISFVLSVLLASLAGSAHCVAMCGGLACASLSQSNEKSGLWLYHLGRGFAYVLLGLLVGRFGEAANGFIQNSSIHWVADITVAALFLTTAVQIWKGGSLHLPFPKYFLKLSSRLLGNALKTQQSSLFSRGLLLGILTPLLPCGWLYSALLVAMATKNPLHAGFTMLFFWLGTLPAMILAPSVFKKITSPMRKSTPKLVSVIFILLGVWTLSHRMPMLHKNTPNPEESCHSQS